MKRRCMLALLEERRIVENADIDENDAQSKFEEVGRRLFPIRDPNAFVAAYARENGNKSVSQIKNELLDLRTNLQIKLQETLEFDQYCHLMESQRDGSSLLSWLGKSFRWVVDIVWRSIEWVMDSWVGQHPVGRIAGALLLLYFGVNIYLHIHSIIKMVFGRFAWVIGTSFVGGLTLVLLTRFIDLMDLFCQSDTLVGLLQDHRISDERMTVKELLGLGT